MRRSGFHPVQFAKDLLHEVKHDQLANGAAALAFYLMLSLFPAAIFLLSLLPYLPIPHLEQAIMEVMNQVMPGPAQALFATTVHNVVTHRSGGLLSFGLLFTLWSASSGLFAIMQQLNVTHGAAEERPFWKVRGTAVLLTVLFFLLVVGALALVIGGGALQGWIGSHLGWSKPLLIGFAVLRWGIILLSVLLAFALIYYLGPHTDQRFRLVSPGSVFATIGLLVTSLLFKVYVGNFGNYDKTYGSLGAVIALLMWLYITGFVVLLGAEVNELLTRHAPKPRRFESSADRDDHGFGAHEVPA